MLDLVITHSHFVHGHDLRNINDIKALWMKMCDDY